MSYLDLTLTSAPPTPITNHVEVYVDSVDKHLKTIDDVGTISDLVGVETIHADANPNLTGNVQLVSGTNITLSQVGQAITINSTGGGGAPPNFVQANRSSQTTISTNLAWVATGIKLTITPSSSTVPVFVSAMTLVQAVDSGLTGEVAFTIFRDTTAAQGAVISDGVNISLDPSPGLMIGHQPLSASTAEVTGLTFNGIDVPGSTSPHTYTVAFFNEGSAGRWDVGERASILAFEIH